MMYPIKQILLSKSTFYNQWVIVLTVEPKYILLIYSIFNNGYSLSNYFKKYLNLYKNKIKNL
jgi:hypothetical protein